MYMYMFIKNKLIKFMYQSQKKHYYTSISYCHVHVLIFQIQQRSSTVIPRTLHFFNKS